MSENLRTSIDNSDNNVYTLMTKSDDQIIDALGTNKISDDKQLLSDNLVSNEEINDSNENNLQSRKSLYRRLFSSMEAGSLRGSIFAMSSLALGTGCLALPYRFSQMSFLNAIIMLILGAIIAYWSLTIMIEASIKSNTGANDYSRLVKVTLGTSMALVLDIFILIYIFGILTSYQVMSNFNI